MNAVAAAFASLIVLAGAWSAVTRPSNTARETREGIEQLEANDAAAAKVRFQRAAEWSGGDPVHLFNAATAALEARQTEEGLRLNAQVARESPELADDAAYNAGTAFLRQQRPEEAIGLLRESLRMNPHHLDAKRNLELAERMRQENNQSGGDSGQQDTGGDDQSEDRGESEGAGGQAETGGEERGEVNPEEVLRAVAQQEAEELRRMRGRKAEGYRRGRGW